MRSYSVLVHDTSQLISFLEALTLESPSHYLVQLFSTDEHRIAQSYNALISQRIPAATVIGHSSRHVIYQDKVQNTGTLVILSCFQNTRFSAAAVDLSRPLQAASLLADELRMTAQTKAIISFSRLCGGREREFYLALNDLANVPISGGIAVDVDGKPAWSLLNGNIYHDAAVAVALHSEKLQVWRNAFSEWNPIGTPMRVTSSSKNIIHAINHQPAYEVYRERLSDGKKITLEELLSFPIMRANQKATIPRAIRSDGSIEFDANVDIGEEVRICYNHPSLTMAQVEHDTAQLAQVNPESVFIYNCESRLGFVEGVNEIKSYSGFEFAAGSFCLGELYSRESQALLHHSMTYLALSEDSSRTPIEFSDREELTISPLLNLIRYTMHELDQGREQMEVKLAKQAEKLLESYRLDKHTGLKNRVALQERLKVTDPDEHIITLKLTNFHQINEKYGYSVADELTRDISDYFVDRIATQRGKEYVRNLYYIGTAEWAVVFRSRQDSQYIQQQFIKVADEVEHINFEPFGLPEVDYLSVSITGGIASAVDFPNCAGEELLVKAIDARKRGEERNTHLYNAKNCATTQTQQQEQLSLMGSVSRAILDQKILTYSQPIYSAKTKNQVSQECLVRIEDNGEIISPGRFLPIIEGTHLYTRLSRHMMSSTLNHMADKQESFSINLSPQDMLSDKTLYLLEESVNKLNDPTRLGIEVLESEQIKDFSRMVEVCEHFKRMGVRLMVDDFGSGYSNIDEIIRLEPDIIKLDGSLIKTIDQDEKQRQITGQLVKLCQVLNAKTVAEFVHNRQVCEVAIDLGVDYLQGFYLAEPERLF